MRQKDEDKLGEKLDKILLHKPMQQKELKKSKTAKPESKKRPIQKESK